MKDDKTMNSNEPMNDAENAEVMEEVVVKPRKISDEKRAQMRKSTLKHIVTCPHCGSDVLDHQTECDVCHGSLDARGYTPSLTKKQTWTIKIILGAILIIGLVIYIIMRSKG